MSSTPPLGHADASEVDSLAELVADLRRNVARHVRAGAWATAAAASPRVAMAERAAHAKTPLMFVSAGESHADTGETGELAGPASELLDKMIVAMGWAPDTVRIVNVGKSPAAGEALDEQIAALAPNVIVALGQPATKLLLSSDAAIDALRGQIWLRGEVHVMPTFHPAYLLREPSKKREAWSDLKAVMAELERLGIKAPGA